MALGSYSLGASVKIPLQVTEGAWQNDFLGMSSGGDTIPRGTKCAAERNWVPIG